MRTVDEEPKVNSKYDPKTLTSSVGYINELKQINTETQEGFDRYKELTGLPIDDVSAMKIGLTHQQIYADVSEGLDKYVSTHIESTTNEIDEMGKLNIGFGFCSDIKSESESYNTAREAVHTAKKQLRVFRKVLRSI